VYFEWDERKNESNRKKHDGIDFSTAAKVFMDPEHLVRKDRIVDGEQRWHAIGFAAGSVLLVVHVYREESPNGQEVIRIISAREANARERGIYYSQAAH
jgi:hypothetical protein